VSHPRTTVPFDLPTVDDALAADIARGLTDVERQLRDAVRSEDAFVTEASRHLVDAGGKRFRATLVLLAAHFGDATAAEVIPSAVVVELTHLATLYHDDVMDEASLRRGEASANSRWNNTIAILTGDLLFARASDIVSGLGPEAVRIQAHTFSRLVHGQIQETVGPPADGDPMQHYLDVVADKTGSLIATSGQFGTMFARADAGTIDIVTRACESIGIAFQLSDDILDVAGESSESGKTPGTDLREGVHTLPMLHAMQSADPAGQRLRDLLSTDLTDDALHAEALALLRADVGMEQARADLHGWADAARTEILKLPASPARAALESLCDYVVDRTA